MFTMSTPSIYLAEELLALPAAQRELLANLLFDSLKTDGRSDEEIAANLRSRLERLKTGADAGLSFEQVFGEAM
jgi:putative addiction module component (TIGR02574 family)